MSKGWIAVRNIKTDSPSAHWVFYCGRDLHRMRRGMLWGDLGNPYRVNEHQTREEAIARHKAEFAAGESERAKEWERAANWMEREICKGKTVELFCHCSPLPCHCDNFKQAVDFYVATSPIVF